MSCPGCKHDDVLWDEDEWVFNTDDGMPEPPIEFCPHCGMELPEEGPTPEATP